MRKYAFEIPCPHEAYGDIPLDKDLPDYHPLTRSEIADLLNFARDHENDGIAVSKAQVRLIQGIPGMTCPRAIDNNVAEREARLSEIFVNRYRLGGTDDLVDAIEMLMSPT
ncbi:MAG: hypothetical protein QG620_65 [Patescibacteria group bacterium]|nr:hypothetical protein [Patescibacteria group bacterium]